MKTGLAQELIEIYTRRESAYERTRAWRFDAAIGHIPTDFFGTLVNAIILSLLIADRAERSLLMVWLLGMSLLATFRFALGLLWRSPLAPSPQFLRRAFTGSLMMHGLVTAVPILLLVPADAVAERCVMLVWLAGTSAWVATAYPLVAEAALGFMIFQFAPVTLLLLLSPERFWQLVGVGCFAFLPSMCVVVLRNHTHLMRGQINHFEKESLAAELALEKSAAEARNVALAADLEQRRLTEAELREAKERAETLAAELEKLSALDGLTGIANRRRFDQIFEREWNRAARSGQPLALILCDIDYFKEYNDRYGHQAGDACLRQLAQLLESGLRRGGDLAARYGGEEFAILLPDTTLAHAVGIAETLRESLRKIAIPHAGSRIGASLSASFGVAAVLPDRGRGTASLLRDADEALYRAKAAGRDRVAVAGVGGTMPGHEEGLDTRLH